MFGVSEGTRPATSMTYWEALRSAWRLTWPLGIAVTLGVYFAKVGIRYGYLPNPIETPTVLAAFSILTGMMTFISLPRLTRRKYRGFSLTFNAEDGDRAKMPIGVRVRIWRWLVLREFLACAIGWFLLGPLNILLGLLGVHQGALVLALAFALGVRPVMMILLMQNYFGDFQLELIRNT